MSRHLLFYCILTGFVAASNALTILVVQPLTSTSHHVWTMSLVEGLLLKGHRVHLVSIHEPNIQDKLTQNLTFATFDNIMTDLFASSDYDPTEWNTLTTYDSIQFQYIWAYDTCERVTNTKGGKDLLEMVKNMQFDVIVQDVTFTECLLGLWEVAKGKPPVVGFIPYGYVLWAKDYVGGVNYPTVQTYKASNTLISGTFQERVWNTLYFMTDDFLHYYYYLPKAQRLAEKYVGHKISPLLEIQRNINMLLINTHSSFDPEIPLPSNALQIAGLHAQNSKPVTDKRLRQFLDEAKDGVVIVSLGTNVDWKYLEPEKVQAVVDALSKLKQRVIWKLKANLPLKISDNIMIVKWLPQNDVLTHKNVKAIWAHGGLLSTHEAVWHGIPLIGMPFFLDQRPNMERVVAQGAGVRLELKNLNTQSVLDAFEQVLYNESVIKNMKQWSSEFRDRPVPPLDLAIWGIEYAAHHPSNNLASPIRFQNWYQQNMIDVYLILLFILITLLLTVFFILRMLYIFYCQYRTCKSSKNKRE